MAEKCIKFNNMNLNDLEKQLQEIQKIDTTTLTPEQLQELIDKLSSNTDIGEEMIYNDIQEIEDEEEYDDYLTDYSEYDDSDSTHSDEYDEYDDDLTDYNENESYDNENNS